MPTGKRATVVGLYLTLPLLCVTLSTDTLIKAVGAGLGSILGAMYLDSRFNLRSDLNLIKNAIMNRKQ
jgi:hypothetical protein